jgi:5-methylcytosine-specific restriction protein A
MPTVPSNTKCSMLGCSNLRTKYNTLCLEHGGRNSYNHTDKRIDALAKYNSNQWRKLRHIQLSKHPLCLSCLSDGRIVQAIHIDHVFPWAHYGSEAFQRNIFQSLCQPCHSTKTGLEQRGIYRHYAIPVKDYKREDYPYVMAENGL